jgi:SAM-dependent MidA family methyltransferase
VTPLETEIHRIVESDGPVPVGQYMALCLGHPTHGYYQTRDPFGAAGDFVTAPEISQMFGELIGLWAAAVWGQMGAPPSLRLVELGPGRGTLMADALRAIKVVPGFRAALRLHLVETSPVLRDCQSRILAGHDVPLVWHRELADVPDGPLIVVANEFIDALPVEQAVRAADGWHQRMVGTGADGRLAFALHPDP